MMKELISMLNDCIEKSDREILPTDKLKEDLMVTSFSMMMFLLKLEEYTGRSADAQMLAKANTVQDLYDYLTKLCSQASDNGDKQ